MTLRFWTPTELAAVTPAEPDWIIPGFLGREMLTEIDGKVKKSGKTTLTLDMVSAILDGRSWLGRPVKQSRVIYLTEQQRGPFRAALSRAGLQDRGEELLVLFRYEFASMRWADIVANVAERAKQEDAAVVVVDTIAKLAGIRDENNAADWTAALDPLTRIAYDGTAVLMCRHSRKGDAEVGEAGRGSSAASGDVDIILDLRRPTGNQPSTRRVLEGLGRYSEDTPEKIVIDLTPEGYVLLGDDEAVAFADAERIASALLGGEFGRNGIDTDTMVAESANADGGPLSRSTVQRVLRHLTSRGVVRTWVDDGGKARKGHPQLYAFSAESYAAATPTEAHPGNGIAPAGLPGYSLD